MSILSLSSFGLNLALLVVLIMLLLILLIGLHRVWQGPTIQDRFIATLLLGSGGVAKLFLLAVLMNLPALYDVALVLALLAVVITIALTRSEATHNA